MLFRSKATTESAGRRREKERYCLGAAFQSTLGGDDPNNSFDNRLEGNKSLASKDKPEQEVEQASAPKAGKTAAGRAVADAMNVERWKAIAALMIKVALELGIDCGPDGPKPRTRSDLRRIAVRALGKVDAIKLFGKGQELPTALEAFWDALPDEHKQTTPGAPRTK